MRFHRLEVTAFGPYPGTEVVDFDALNEAGVFLMTGPTGAGKTSLLDAVCFALYGVVPGDRGTKALRSHHAPADARPEVVLELTLGVRRLRVHRSPEWWRPKKRGTGTTKEQASARLVDLTGGGERLVSARIPEVGHELMLALGMSSEQFMQVVLLPQGRFQTFLRASSDERQQVLQRLFATERFARIEDWMHDQARTAQGVSARGERQVLQVLGGLSTRSGEPVPEPLGDLGRLSPDDARTLALGWAGALVTTAEAAAAHAAEADAAARADLADLEVRHARAAADHALLQRRTAAERHLADLATREAEITEARRLLDAHRRAATVLPVTDAVAALRQRLTSARTSLASLVGAAGGVPGPSADLPDPAACQQLRDGVAARLAALRAAAPQAEALAAAQDAAATARAERERLDAEAGAVVETLAQQPALRERAATAAERAESAATRIEHLRERHRDAGRRLRAATALVAARAGLARDELTLLEAREHAAAAHEQHLALLERRLRGMAGELAHQLVDGEPCQVCGSVEHPDPAASRDATRVTEADQAASLAAHLAARDEADGARARVEEGATRVALLEQEADGRDEETARAELDVLGADLVAAEELAATAPALRAALDALDAEHQALLAHRDDLVARRQRAEATVERWDREADTLTAAVASVVGEHPDLATAAAHEERRLGAVDDLIDRVREVLGLEEQLATARDQADELARAQGFTDLDDVTGALLDDPRPHQLALLLEEVDRVGTEARRVLADPDVVALTDRLAERHDNGDNGDNGDDAGDEDDGPSAPEDPALVALLLRDARRRAEEVTTTRATSADAARALRRSTSELAAALDSWAPDHERSQVTSRLARLVRGTGGDNQLQMRLSSYVLATRLDQVLDAANERLGQMRDHRYELRRTGRTRGGVRSGLDLEVLDAWTGESRDAATLSGGETFVVSLALALGLADVVGQESGGTRVDTLFVDEGFSALDPDTLDDVMDRIDALRSGGRTVGVVSHVTELRARIPVQLHVETSRTGSTVRTATSVA